jgi:Ca2+-transporting ATPase
MGEIFTILLSLILLTEHAPLFSALMILWINLVTDGSLTVALAMEPKESDVMKRPPVNRNEAILNRELLRAILFTSIIMAGSVLFITSVYASTASIDRKQTLAFTTLALLQIINAINCRSRTQSLFQLGWFSNKPISYGVIISIVLQIIAIYVGFFNLILGTTPLTFIDWIVVTIAAGVLFIAEELRKLVFRKSKTGLIKFPSKKTE